MPTSFPTLEPSLRPTFNPSENVSAELQAFEIENNSNEIDFVFNFNSFVGLLIIFGTCVIISSICLYYLLKHTKKQQFEMVPTNDNDDML
eukprot:TRINITY_DN1480_c0_g1_i1.p1 TRINITY_DN1480_c0_g1~~TRINITY_DN1480_c0_g1_i1.p1  ORF type:complete len:103 (+),score=25.82 TRINITY_DN1480_c0_g1_i1:40-309(+)